jgi:hypothetical protein
MVDIEAGEEPDCVHRRVQQVNAVSNPFQECARGHIVARILVQIGVLFALASGAQAANIAEVQLLASVAVGGTVAPEVVNADGTQTPFSIPPNRAFVVTDVSIQRLSVVAGPDLFSVNLQQTTVGTINRWAFVGSISQNVERSLVTGIKFSTPFMVQNLASSADVVIVRLFGYFDKP